jgi:hypothetical protein
VGGESLLSVDLSVEMDEVSFESCEYIVTYQNRKKKWYSKRAPPVST